MVVYYWIILFFCSMLDWLYLKIPLKTYQALMVNCLAATHGVITISTGCLTRSRSLMSIFHIYRLRSYGSLAFPSSRMKFLLRPASCQPSQTVHNSGPNVCVETSKATSNCVMQASCHASCVYMYHTLFKSSKHL